MQYDIFETFFLIPRSAILHRMDFFHLDGLQGSGLKEHISPQNKQFSLKLKGSSVGRLRLTTESSTLAHFWVGAPKLYAHNDCYLHYTSSNHIAKYLRRDPCKYFAMWYEDV